MTSATPEALIAATLVLVQDHADVLHDEAQRLAQAHNLERVAARLDAATDPVSGTVVLRPDAAVVIFTALGDCVGRLRVASEHTPALLRVRARLLDWQDELTLWRDRAITQRLRKGPAARRDVKRRTGWNRAAPGA